MTTVTREQLGAGITPQGRPLDTPSLDPLRITERDIFTLPGRLPAYFQARAAYQIYRQCPKVFARVDGFLPITELGTTIAQGMSALRGEAATKNGLVKTPLLRVADLLTDGSLVGTRLLAIGGAVDSTNLQLVLESLAIAQNAGVIVPRLSAFSVNLSPSDSAQLETSLMENYVPELARYLGVREEDKRQMAAQREAFKKRYKKQRRVDRYLYYPGDPITTHS